MFKHDISHQGFTLVELSIVLVVIGLLIGGILIGQSLIESAKISAQVKQLQQFDIATQSFLSKFRRVPGDGNRDGTIGCCDVYGNSEERAFFPELSTYLGFPGNYSSAQSSKIFGAGFNAPVSSMGTAGVIPGSSLKNGIWWIIAIDKEDTNTSSGPTLAFTPAQALTMEKKLDDGDPFNGDVAIAFSDNTVFRPYRSCSANQVMFCNAGVNVLDPDYYASTVWQQYQQPCAATATSTFKTTTTTPVCGLQFKAKITR